MGLFDNQVGGDHYKHFAIQPALLIHRNGLGYLEGNIVKRAHRHAVHPCLAKQIEDLHKIMDECKKLLYLEHGHICGPECSETKPSEPGDGSPLEA